MREDRQPPEQAGAQVQRLEPVERGDDREQAGVAVQPRDGQHARAAHDQRGQVNQRQEAGAERRADPLACPLREHQREVQEHRRQGEQRHHVGPVEQPVEPVEPSGKRKREHAEERHRQPEQVERRLVARPAQADPGADHQREDPDRRQDEIEEAVALGNGREPDLHDFARAQPEQRVGQRRGTTCDVRRGDHIRRAFHGPAVDGEQHIAEPHAGSGGRRTVGQFRGGDPVRTRDPQHAVLDFVPCRPDVDIGETEAEQHQCHREGREPASRAGLACPRAGASR